MFVHFLKRLIKLQSGKNSHNQIPTRKRRCPWIFFIRKTNIKWLSYISVNGSEKGLWKFFPIVFFFNILENRQTMTNFSIDKMYMKYFVQILHICTSSPSFLESFFWFFWKCPAAIEFDENFFSNFVFLTNSFKDFFKALFRS